MTEQDEKGVAHIVQGMVACSVAIYLWPEICSMKLLTDPQSRYTPPSHRYAEGYK